MKHQYYPKMPQKYKKHTRTCKRNIAAVRT